MFFNPVVRGIDVGGRQRKTVEYAPNINDMLSEFFETADRDRLCFMKYQIEAR